MKRVSFGLGRGRIWVGELKHRETRAGNFEASPLDRPIRRFYATSMWQDQRAFDFGLMAEVMKRGGNSHQAFDE